MKSSATEGSTRGRATPPGRSPSRSRTGRLAASRSRRAARPFRCWEERPGGSGISDRRDIVLGWFDKCQTKFKPVLSSSIPTARVHTYFRERSRKHRSPRARSCHRPPVGGVAAGGEEEGRVGPDEAGRVRAHREGLGGAGREILHHAGGGIGVV